MLSHRNPLEDLAQKQHQRKQRQSLTRTKKNNVSKKAPVDEVPRSLRIKKGHGEKVIKPEKRKVNIDEKRVF